MIFRIFRNMWLKLILKSALINFAVFSRFVSMMVNAEIVDDGSETQYSVSFDSKVPEISLRKSEMAIPGSCNSEMLIQLCQAIAEFDPTKIEIDFIVDGKLLRETLKDHFLTYNLGTEHVIPIEVIHRTSAPQDKSQHTAPDWVSSIKCISGRVVFGCYDNAVRVVDDRDEPFVIHSSKFPINCVDLSYKNLVAVASRSSQVEVLKCDLTNFPESEAEILFSLEGHVGPVSCLSFDEEEERLCSVGHDGMLKIWSAAEQDNDLDKIEPKKKRKTEEPTQRRRAPLVTLAAHSDISNLCFWCKKEFSNEIISAGFDNTMKVFDINTLKPRDSYTRDRPFSSIDRSSISHLLAVASFDSKIRVYDVRMDRETLIIQTMEGHDQLVSCVKWSSLNGHNFISGSYDKVVKMWDVRSPKVALYDISKSEGKVLACDWMENEIYFGGEDCKIFHFSSKA